MVSTALIYKAANIWALKGKDKHQLSVLVVHQESLDHENSFSGLVPSMICPWRKYLACKGLPFKVLLILDKAPGHPEPHEFNIKVAEVVSLPPNTTSQSQPLDQGVGKTFKAHHTQYAMERIVSAMEENPDGENIMKVWKDYTFHWRCRCYYRKSCESHQARNNKFLLEKTLSRCCEWLHRIYDRTSQGNPERDCGYDKKVGSKGFQNTDLGEIQELIDTTPEELTEDVWMLLPDNEEEDVEEAVPANKLTLDIPSEGFWFFKTAFAFFYDMDGPFYEMGTETKVKNSRRIDSI